MCERDNAYKVPARFPPKHRSDARSPTNLVDLTLLYIGMSVYVPSAEQVISDRSRPALLPVGIPVSWDRAICRCKKLPPRWHCVVGVVILLGNTIP
jgi:hypothetical protein